MHIEIRRNRSLNPFNRYYLVGVATNGEDMWTSESYYSKSNAKRAATSHLHGTGILVYDCTKAGKKVQL